MEHNIILKRENSLYKVTKGDKVHYFTNFSRCGKFFHISHSSVELSFLKEKPVKTRNNEYLIIEIVDGSEIPFKMID